MGIHSGDIGSVLEQIERAGWPPHQAIFYCGRKSMYMAGLIETEEPGVFWSWTIHGKHMTHSHYPFIIKETRAYFKRLDFKTILHIIHKDKPWTRRMARLFRFSYVKDIDSERELWEVRNGC